MTCRKTAEGPSRKCQDCLAVTSLSGGLSDLQPRSDLLPHLLHHGHRESRRVPLLEPQGPGVPTSWCVLQQSK